MKRKIVIKVSMPSDKSRSKAMVLLSGVSGVNSMTITGDLKDRLEVVGEDVDAVSLISCLRRNKFGHVEILTVEEVKDKKKEEKKEEKDDKDKKPPECCCPGYPCYAHPGPLPMVFCEREPANACSIM